MTILLNAPTVREQERCKIKTVPLEWCVERLGAVAETEYGISESSSESPNAEMIGMKHLANGVTKFTNLIPVSVGDEDVERYRVRTRDLLFNRTNSLDLVGKTSICMDVPHDRILFASYLVRIHPDESRLMPEFVNYFMNSQIGVFRIKTLATPGVGQYNVNPTSLRNQFLIPLPPLAEQRMIAEILSTWDRAIELTEKMISAKQKRKQALMQKLLTGKVRFGNRKEEWPTVSLKDVTREHAFGPRFSSAEYAPDGNIGSIRTTDLDTDGKINYETIPYATLPVKTIQSHILNSGDLLITRSGTCGIPCVFEKQSKPIVAGAFLIRFQLVKDVNPLFLFAMLKSRPLQKQIVAMASGGVQKNLTGTNLLKIRFPLPNLPEQDAIVQLIVAAESEIDNWKSRKSKLVQQKKGLMQQLLTGKTRVKIDADGTEA